MNGHAFIDAARGEVVLGDLALPFADADPPGALRLLPPAGPVLRPITFGERFRLVERASVAADPVENLCAAIMKCATVSPGDMDLSPSERSACQTLALMLAGAGIEAPPFAESMLLVGGSAGWHYREIEEAEASRIDHLARRLEPKLPDPDDGWSRVVFQEEPASGPDAIRRDLATRLLSRFADPDAGGAEDIPQFFGTDRPAADAIMPESWSRSASDSRQTGASAGDGRFGEGGRFGEVKGDGRTAESGAHGVEEHGAGVPVLSALWPDGAQKTEGNGESPSLPPKRRAKVLGYTLEGWEKRSDASTAAPAHSAGDERGAAGLQRAASPGATEPAFAASHEAGISHADRIASGGSVPASPEAEEEMRSSAVRSLARSIAGRHDGAPASAGVPRGASAMPSPAAAPVSGRPAAPATMPGHGVVGMPPMAGGIGPAPRSWSFSQESDEAEAAGMTSAVPVIAGSLGRPEESGVASIIMELADALAELLHEEADLRGIDR